jgi:hypothetical protein
MAGDWAHDELFEIAVVELMILGLSVALYVNRRSHCLFPPVCSRLQGSPSFSPPTAARHPFPDRKLPELCRVGSISDIGAVLIYVRFTPESRYRASIEKCLLCAISRHRGLWVEKLTRQLSARHSVPGVGA